MTLLQLLSAIAGFIKVRFLADKEVIDNVTFRLHYRVTSAIFFGGCILCTAYTFIGDPITCKVDDDLWQKAINIYCWVTSTFSVPKHFHKKVGVDVAHPGTGHATADDEIIHHAYYQWVPFVLFFQGVLFYIPHWIWKSWEQGKIKELSDGIRGVSIADKSERKEKQSVVVEYLLESLNTHNGYTIRYIICEVLNFVNAIGNIYFINKFLGGVFLTYGIKVIQFNNMDQADRTDPMIEIFPRVTKCHFSSYGAGGSEQNKDVLCIMAMNILNEKIYILLWFYLIILSIFSGCAIIYSSLNVVYPGTRKSILRRIFHVDLTDHVKPLLNKLSFGDFFLLHLLGQNVNSFTFKEIVNEMSTRIHDFKRKYPSIEPYEQFGLREPVHEESTPPYSRFHRNAGIQNDLHNALNVK